MNSIAIIEDKKIVPKPTKADIRLAMAKAIRDKQLEARQAEEKLQRSAREKLHAKALKLLKKRGIWGTSVESWRETLTIEVELTNADPEAADIIKALNDLNRTPLPRVQSDQDIVKDLIKSERNQAGSTVDKLLSDPAIKKQLLDVGQKLLNGGVKPAN
jgi:type I site-specific restriction endonuclease